MFKILYFFQINQYLDNIEVMMHHSILLPLCILFKSLEMRTALIPDIHGNLPTLEAIKAQKTMMSSPLNNLINDITILNCRP